MSEYRVYFLNETGSVHAPAVGVIAVSDEAAMDAAAKVVFGGAAEVWIGLRLVGVLPVRSRLV